MNPSKSEIADFDRDLEVSFLPMEAVGEDGSLDLSRTRRIGDVETGYTYFRNGDVTFAKITPCFENGKGALMQGLRHGAGFGTTELTVARAIAGQSEPSFIDWLFRSPGFRNNGEASMYGAGGQKRVPDEFVREFQVALPPIDEQKRLGQFLGIEAAKIDGLISEQEKLIALLKEKRKAVISHAVTKGLDPSVPIKDSGIEWLGEVPAHWEVLPLRRVISSIEQGWSPDCFARCAEVEEWGVLKAGCVNRGVFVEAENKALPPELKPEEKYEVRAGDVLMSRASGSPELVGSTALVSSTRPRLMLSDKIFRIHLHATVLPGYFVAVFNSRSMRSQIEIALSGGNGMANNLPQAELMSFHACIPPVCEQDELCRRLDREDARIGRLVSEAERAVELLAERRSALISAAITGKIDVRGA